MYINLNQRWNEYKNAYRYEHAKDLIKNVIKNQSMPNVNLFHRDIHRSALQIEQIKRLRDRFGVILADAIKDEDYSSALDWLNDREFRLLRQTINDPCDLFYEKFGTYFCACEDCGRIESEDDMQSAYDGERIVCSSCMEDYYYHIRSGQYVHQDDENYSENDEDDSIIGEYHSSSDQLGKIPSEFDKRKSQVFLGLELEMEVTDDYSRSDKAEYILENLKICKDHKGNFHNYCLLENDGSLNNGFEMVTGYTGLDVHEKQLAFFKKPVRGLRSHDTNTCGLHIHIDKRHMTLNHATKLILFMHDSGNQKLIKTIARRSSSRFAKVVNKKADYAWLKSAKRSNDPLCNLNDDRYESLNFQNERTVEFRLFKGTLKFESIMACLEFTYAAWFFCKDHGYNDLTTENFIKFICLDENKADTKYLRAYLKQHLFDIPEVPKQNPRIENKSLVTDEI
jgi:hypothetical protein